MQLDASLHSRSECFIESFQKLLLINLGPGAFSGLQARTVISDTKTSSTSLPHHLPPALIRCERPITRCTSIPNTVGHRDKNKMLGSNITSRALNIWNHTSCLMPPDIIPIAASLRRGIEFSWTIGRCYGSLLVTKSMEVSVYVLNAVQIAFYVSANMVLTHAIDRPMAFVESLANITVPDYNDTRAQPYCHERSISIFENPTGADAKARFELHLQRSAHRAGVITLTIVSGAEKGVQSMWQKLASLIRALLLKILNILLSRSIEAVRTYLALLVLIFYGVLRRPFRLAGWTVHVLLLITSWVLLRLLWR